VEKPDLTVIKEANPHVLGLLRMLVYDCAYVHVCVCLRATVSA